MQFAPSASHAESPLPLGPSSRVQRDNGESAIATIERMVGLEPNNVTAWSKLARACLETKRLVYAEAASARALALDPTHFDSLIGYGRTLIERGEVAEAIAMFSRARTREPSSAEAALHLARAFELAGESAKALTEYRNALRLAPANFDALNNCGLLLLNHGELDAAITHLVRALEVEPGRAVAHYNLGLAYRRKGQLSLAITSYEKAIAIRSEYPDALNNLGNIYTDLGCVSEAENCFRRAIASGPKLALAYTNLIVLLCNVKRYEEAEKVLEAAARQLPTDVGILFHRAVVHNAQGNLDLAESLLDEVLAHEPLHVDARELKAFLLKKRNDFQKAIETLQVLPDGGPNASERWTIIGAMHMESGQHEAALACFERSLRANPDSTATANNVALAMKRLGRLDDAITILRRTLERHYESDTVANLGSMLLDKRELGEAMRLLDEAIERFPAVPKLHCNRGVARLERGDFHGAEEAFEEALRLDPDLMPAAWNLSFCLLARGEFARGWECYETRLRLDMPADVRSGRFSESVAPLWNGESLSGKSLLILGEQGLGDQIQMLRFGAELERRGARVTVVVNAALRTLAESARGVYAASSAIPSQAFDYAVQAMSLPRLLGVCAVNIPGKVPYVAANPDKVCDWRRRLDALGNKSFRVGLVWAGNPAHPNDRNRSISLEQFGRVLSDLAVCWVAVNKAILADLVVSDQIVHALGKDCGDFSDTAALVAALDLVITVDTSVAHLAGALNKECWVLIPVNTDWRWMLDRSDSPWYPSVRLFRQREFGHWEPTLDEVRHSLRDRLGPQHLAAPLPLGIAGPNRPR